MNRAVWMLLTLGIVSWGICGVYPTAAIHFGWIGILCGSAAGLIATTSSYLTEKKVDTRGGTIYKSESPIKFLLAYVFVGLPFAALVFISVFGCLERIGY